MQKEEFITRLIEQQVFDELKTFESKKHESFVKIFFTPGSFNTIVNRLVTINILAESA